MKIVYTCEYCGAMYHSEDSAHRCEVAHEGWVNSDVKITGIDFTCLSDYTPEKIRLSNKNGVTYVYGRVSRENR